MIEAPEKNSSSTLNVIEKEWPVTEPKRKANHKDQSALTKSLARSPIKINNPSKNREDSFNHDVSHYAEKILLLKEARRLG